ncbi:MAG: hypothetical protein AAFZ17_11645 [Cyanobacteria bacterium J06650_10]
MASLEQQLSELVNQLEYLRDSIAVDDGAIGVTLEQHSPGNGSTYTRIRAQKGKKLANDKRTMSLSPEEAEVWKQKIYARNQRAKIVQCLTLIQQAADVAGAIAIEFGDVELVNETESFTSRQAQDAKPGVATPKPATAITHVKTKRGSLTHAVAGIMPLSGPWHVSALCGAKPPKQDYYGWEIPGIYELTCGKCYRKLPENYERHFPYLG